MEMSPPVMVGFIVFVILVILLFIIGIHRAMRKRTKELEAISRIINYSFSKQGSDELLSSLSPFHLFSLGDYGKISNVLSGQKGQVNIKVFDYTFFFRTGSGDSPYSQTVICFESPNLQLPHFMLRPKDIVDKIGKKAFPTFSKMIGFDIRDIVLSTYPTFSEKYLLYGKDEHILKQYFSDDLIKFYEGQKAFSTEGAGHCLICYKRDDMISPDQIRSFIQQGVRVFDLFQRVGRW